MKRNYNFLIKKSINKSITQVTNGGSSSNLVCASLENNSIAYNTQKNKNCLIVQNNVKLNDTLPDELKNLDYGIYSTNVSYYLLRLVYNRAINYFPQVIFYPSTYNEVSFLIKTLFNYRSSIDFTIRCGGHAYEPASVSNGVIIDVSRLNTITFKENNVINSQSGIKLGALVDVMNQTGLIIPTGHNVCVGLSGLALGGGKGELSRLHGLTCDNIISCKVMNYQGEILNVNEEENSELLYGIRGAGTNNFGLVLEMDLQAYPDVYYIQETIKWNWNKTLCLEVLKLYINTINNNQDNNLLYEFHMQSNEYSNQVSDFYVKVTRFFDVPNENDLEESNNFKLISGGEVTQEKGYYSKNLSWVDYGNGLQAPFSKIKSSMLYNDQEYTNEQLNILIESIDIFVINKINADYQINISELNGKVAENANINSCYFPRDATSVMSYFIQWPIQEDSQDYITFLEDVWNDFRPFASPFCLTNLIDYDIDDYMFCYYGDMESQEKLKIIKNQYDPTNFFKWKQSIPLL
tara:strand:+ start:5226 stop:6788 length:1563 start_codon:yes stop_codon:yes gene_type:complete